MSSHLLALLVTVAPFLFLGAVDIAQDPVRFAKEVLRIELWPHQQDAVRSDNFMIAIAGGRRSGKTLAAQVRALWVALTRRGGRVLVLAPTIDSARNWLRELHDLVRASPVAGSVLDEQAQMLRLSTSSAIEVIPATPGQARGRGRDLRLVVLIEAAYHGGHVWRDVLYTLADLRSEGSQLWMDSTPAGPADHFFRQTYLRGLDGDPDVASFHWRMADNPTLAPGFIDRLRDRMSPHEAAAEVDGEWIDAVGSMFPRELLEAVTVDVALA